MVRAAKHPLDLCKEDPKGKSIPQPQLTGEEEVQLSFRVPSCACSWRFGKITPHLQERCICWQGYFETLNVTSLIQKLISIWQMLMKLGELLRASKQLWLFPSWEITDCTCQPSNAKTHFFPSVSRGEVSDLPPLEHIWEPIPAPLRRVLMSAT